MDLASKWNKILNHLQTVCEDENTYIFLTKHNEFIEEPAADWCRTPDELVIVIISTLNINGVQSINLGKLCSIVQKINKQSYKTVEKYDGCFRSKAKLH